MSGYDQQTFNQAIALAGAGRKDEAHELLERLLQTNTADSNLYLWFAYTSSDLAKASNAIELAHRYSPHDPNISRAQAWLAQQLEQQYQQGRHGQTDFATTANQTDFSSESSDLLRSLPSKLQRMASKVLKPQETLRWVGRPNFLKYMIGSFGFIFLAVGILLLCATVPLLYVEFFQNGTFQLPRGRSSASAWPFVTGFSGLLNVITAYVKLHNATRIAYIVTDRRALIINAGWPKSIKFYTRAEIKPYNLKVVNRSGGYGDLIFATQVDKYSNRDPADSNSELMSRRRRRISFNRGAESRAIGSDGEMGIEEIGFIGIPQVHQVAELFLEVFDSPFLLPELS